MSVSDIKSMLISSAGFSAGIAIGITLLNIILKIMGPIILRTFFGFPWVYNGNNGSLNQIDDANATELVSNIINKLNVPNPSVMFGNKSEISQPQLDPSGHLHKISSSGTITFGSFDDYDEKFYYIRTYNSSTKITMFFVFWKTPNRSIMKRFIENYKISNNRNVIDGHITSEKIVVNIADRTSTNQYLRCGRVDNINSKNIIGTQHTTILNTVTDMYSNINRYTSSGFTVRRVFCLFKTNLGSGADDIIEMIANESGLDLYYHQINTSSPYTTTLNDSSSQIPLNLASFYPRDNVVTVYRYSDIKKFLLMACITNYVCDVDDSSVIDHLVTCNPSNSLIFIVCDDDSKYTLLRSNKSIDLCIDVKNEIDDIQTGFDLSFTNPHVFELASARVILRFLDIWIDDLSRFFKMNRTKYLQFLSNHSIPIENASTDINLIVIQLIRAWKLDKEILTCRDIMGRCRFISVDVENRLFSKLF